MIDQNLNHCLKVNGASGSLEQADLLSISVGHGRFMVIGVGWSSISNHGMGILTTLALVRTFLGSCCIS